MVEKSNQQSLIGVKLPKDFNKPAAGLIEEEVKGPPIPIEGIFDGGSSPQCEYVEKMFPFTSMKGYHRCQGWIKDLLFQKYSLMNISDVIKSINSR